MSINLSTLTVLFLFYCSFLCQLSAIPLQFQIKGQAGILINADTGCILFEQNANELVYPASTTKVATALYLFKHHSDLLEMPIEAKEEALIVLSQEAKRKSNYTLHPHALEPDGSHIGIKKGEILSLRTLLEGMLIPSGNDAANVMAHLFGPTIPLFVQKMNAYLKTIGCQKTYFLNPHGLHHPEHQTTAYELSLITKEALKIPLFCDIVSKKRFIRPKTNKQNSSTHLQTNRLIREGKWFYPQAIGVKTGYHAKAKKTFIGAAHLDGRTLIVVLLGYQNRNEIYEDAIRLFDAAFNQPKVKKVFLKEGLQKTRLELPNSNVHLETALNDDLSLEFYPAEEPTMKCMLHWESLELPIQKGERVGRIELISSDGLVLKEAALLAFNDVQLAWPYNWLAVFSALPWLWIFGAILFVLILIFCKRSIGV